MSSTRKTPPPKRKPFSAKKETPNQLTFTRGAYQVNGCKMYGVNTFLDNSVLEPLSESDLKTAKCCTHVAESPVARVELEHTKENTKLSTYHRSLSGVKKGKYLHSQIEKLVEKHKQTRALSASKKKGVCVHPVARSVFAAMQRMDLTIHKSEVGVFSPGRRLATEADLVCVHNKTRRFVVVELKTGYKNLRAYTAPKFRLRFNRKVIVSEQQRHLLQLLTTTILFNHLHPKKTVGDCVLLQAPTHTEALAYSIPDWILAYRSQIEKLIK